MTQTEQGILTFFQENIPRKKSSEKAMKNEDDSGVKVIDLIDQNGSEQERDAKSEPGLEEMTAPQRRRALAQKQNELKQKEKEKARLAKEKQKQEEKLARELKAQEEKKKREQKQQEIKNQRELRLQEEKRKREQKQQEIKNQREELRLQKEQQKLQKEQERLEAKRKKEEEKKAKEEERKAKEEEKRAREEEKRAKEEEKKAKELAKERAQSRIGNFFRKVNDTSVETDVQNDYEKYFLRFHAKEGVVISDASKWGPEKLKESISNIDKLLQNQINNNESLDWFESRKKIRGYKIKYTAVSLLQQMTSKEKSDEELHKMLSLIPQKYIKFYENVRPPFMGTYSKDIVLPATDPFCKEGTGYNYEYDSDLEWVNEEEEGDEIDNLESGEEEDDEEDDDEASEGEFDEFLDSEEKNSNETGSKKKFIGPLIPTVYLQSDFESLPDEEKAYFEKLSAESLIESQSFPIDPFAVQPSISAKRTFTESSQNDSTNSQNSTFVNSPEKKKPKVIITASKDLLKLLEIVQDNTFSLGTLTEIIQKDLPQYNKQIIKNTVKEYANRGTGRSEAARKWEIKSKDIWDQLR